jgi:hypothetical protein
MSDRIRIFKHEAVPECGSFEVRFPDGRESLFFYSDNIPARRLRQDMMDRETAPETEGSSEGCSGSFLTLAQRMEFPDDIRRATPPWGSRSP